MTSRGCAQCGEAKTHSNFSSNQWRKGVGRSRCSDCVAGIESGDPVRRTERINNKSGAVFSVDDITHPFEEGGFRWVALGIYVSGPRAGEPCVAKWFKSGYVMSAADYREDIKCAVKAMQLVRAFNADRIIKTHIRVNIPEVWEFDEETGLTGVKYMLEPYIEDYDKWNSNSGWYDDSTDWGMAMQALSHYSYHKTGGQFLLCDIQGGFDDDGAILSDPAILSRNMSYGVTDMGPEGISSFFALHRCNHYCDETWSKPADPQYFYDAYEGTTVHPYYLYAEDESTASTDTLKTTFSRTEEAPIQPTENENEDEEGEEDPSYYEDENGYYYYYYYADTEDEDTNENA